MTSDLTSEVKWGHWGKKFIITQFFDSVWSERISWSSLAVWVEWPQIWPPRSKEIIEVKRGHWGQKYNIVQIFNSDRSWQFSPDDLRTDLRGQLRSQRSIKLHTYTKGACLRAKRAMYILASTLSGWHPVSEANHVYPSEPPSPRPKGEQCAKRTRVYYKIFFLISEEGYNESCIMEFQNIISFFSFQTNFL